MDASLGLTNLGLRVKKSYTEWPQLFLYLIIYPLCFYCLPQSVLKSAKHIPFSESFSLVAPFLEIR